MTIQFNVTGKERKRLVAAISEVLTQPKEYLGAPDYRYQVGEYIIRRRLSRSFSKRILKTRKMLYLLTSCGLLSELCMRLY